jgi:hypothetical protein
MGLSVAAMALAALGLLPPAAGALLQEAIDLAVIGNALRALRLGRGDGPQLPEGTRSLLRRFAVEHGELRDALALLLASADRLAAGNTAELLPALRRVDRVLADRILPHEQAEETQLYPALAGPLGDEATVPMSRAHAEIARLARRLHTHLEIAASAGRVGPEQVDDLLACLYGLHAVLRLHFVQEEENYFALDPDLTDRGAATA